MKYFKKYMQDKKFKKVLNLGVFDARDITGWFIEHSYMYEKLYLIDNYDFSNDPTLEDPMELVYTVNQKIEGKENIDFWIQDGNEVDYTELDFDLAIVDCDSTSAVKKVINEKPDIVFCMTAFFTSFYRTNLIFEWIKEKRIYPFMYINSSSNIFFTGDKNKHAVFYEEASRIDYGGFIKYEEFMGYRIVCPRTVKPFYEHQQKKL